MSTTTTMVMMMVMTMSADDAVQEVRAGRGRGSQLLNRSK